MNINLPWLVQKRFYTSDPRCHVLLIVNSIRSWSCLTGAQKQTKQFYEGCFIKKNTSIRPHLKKQIATQILLWGTWYMLPSWKLIFSRDKRKKHFYRKCVAILNMTVHFNHGVWTKFPFTYFVNPVLNTFVLHSHTRGGFWFHSASQQTSSVSASSSSLISADSCSCSVGEFLVPRVDAAFPLLTLWEGGRTSQMVFLRNYYVLIHCEGACWLLPLFPSYWEVTVRLTKGRECMRNWWVMWKVAVFKVLCSECQAVCCIPLWNLVDMGEWAPKCRSNEEGLDIHSLLKASLLMRRCSVFLLRMDEVCLKPGSSDIGGSGSWTFSGTICGKYKGRKLTLFYLKFTDTSIETTNMFYQSDLCLRAVCIKTLKKVNSPIRDLLVTLMGCKTSCFPAQEPER